MRTAITVGIHHGGEITELLFGVSTSLDEQRREVKKLRLAGSHERFESIELWESGSGRTIRHKFKPPLKELPKEQALPPKDPPKESTVPPKESKPASPVPAASVAGQAPNEAVPKVDQGDEAPGEFDVRPKRRRK